MFRWLQCPGYEWYLVLNISRMWFLHKQLNLVIRFSVNMINTRILVSNHCILLTQLNERSSLNLSKKNPDWSHKAVRSWNMPLQYTMSRFLYRVYREQNLVSRNQENGCIPVSNTRIWCLHAWTQIQNIAELKHNQGCSPCKHSLTTKELMWFSSVHYN